MSADVSCPQWSQRGEVHFQSPSARKAQTRTVLVPPVIYLLLLLEIKSRKQMSHTKR